MRAGEGPARAVLVGGSFDPVHNGHLHIAAAACAHLGAGVAWLVPAGEPPLRPPTVAAGRDRLDMARAAAAADPRLEVLDLELHRSGPSYTIDTLTDLEARHPGLEIWIVVGADVAQGIAAWHRSAELRARGRFLLIDRAGSSALADGDVGRLGFVAERTRVLDAGAPDVSATEVRRRVAAGEPIDGMVPTAVARLIEERRLYRSSSRDA